MTQTDSQILFVHTELIAKGGGNMVAAWMLEGLKRDYDITLLTWVPVDFSAINQFYGTDIGPSDFKKIIFPPAWLRAIVARVPNDPWQYQRFTILMRWVRIIRSGYNILINANNEIDFGIRGVQYIHYPYQHLNWKKERCVSRGDGRLRYTVNLLKHRLRPWRLISGFRFERMRRNLTLVNSDWTGRKFKDTYHAESVTVYPPVPGGFPDVPWNQRENGFVCIGRISNDKRYEDIIDILTEVRQHFPDIHLHIVGSAVDYDQAYYDQIMKKIAENNAWIHTHESIPRSALVRLLAQHRYGIHGMAEEHFGIAVGEMIRAGSIVFVPDGGGQVEIVGNNSRLLYHTKGEAVEKILHMLRRTDEQEAARRYLHSRKDLFSTEIFMRRVQDIVRNFSNEDE